MLRLKRRDGRRTVYQKTGAERRWPESKGDSNCLGCPLYFSPREFMRWAGVCQKLVSRLGLEPRALALKGRNSRVSIGLRKVSGPFHFKSSNCDRSSTSDQPITEGCKGEQITLPVDLRFAYFLC